MLELEFLALAHGVDAGGADALDNGVYRACLLTRAGLDHQIGQTYRGVEGDVRLLFLLESSGHSFFFLALFCRKQFDLIPIKPHEEDQYCRKNHFHNSKCDDS